MRASSRTRLVGREPERGDPGGLQQDFAFFENFFAKAYPPAHECGLRTPDTQSSHFPGDPSRKALYRYEQRPLKDEPQRKT